MYRDSPEDEDLEPCPVCSCAGRVRGRTCLLCAGDGRVTAEEYDEFVSGEDLDDDS